MKFVIPSLVTILGLCLGLAGVVIGTGVVAAVCLISSIAMDCVDGYVARRIGAQSDFGAALDWHVDAAVGLALTWRLIPHRPIVACVLTAWLVGAQSATRAGWLHSRVSGRTLTTLLLLPVVLRWI